MRIYTKVVVPGLYKKSEYFAARKWCTQTIGASISHKARGAARPWYARRQWASNQDSHGFYNHFQVPSFYFKNPADATMFQLVWAKEFRQT
jgi:hypothetical protein